MSKPIAVNKLKNAGCIAALLLAATMLASCGKSEFGVTESTEKAITITAERAAKDAFLMLGSLTVEDGDQISIISDLTKGSVKVEIVPEPEDQSIDTIPPLDGEAVMTGNLVRTDAESGTVPAGYYLVRATCLEKATGTVRITAEPK